MLPVLILVELVRKQSKIYQNLVGAVDSDGKSGRKGDLMVK